MSISEYSNNYWTTPCNCNSFHILSQQFQSFVSKTLMSVFLVKLKMKSLRDYSVQGNVSVKKSHLGHINSDKNSWGQRLHVVKFIVLNQQKKI